VLPPTDVGLVDAVWSQDSDCLMFGCQLWLRDDRVPKEAGYDNRNKGQTKKAAKTVRVVRTETLVEKRRLKREGCVLFAVLAGGDYDPGLTRCGSGTALKAAQSSLGISLCNSRSQEDCDRWREKVLKPWFKKENITITVPANFPNFAMLQNYNKPKVHPEIVIRDNPELRRDYRRKVHEQKLLLVTSHRFNTWGKGYMDWVVPTMLTRFLAERDSFLPREAVHEIKPIATRKKKGDDSVKFERKITFSPFGLTQLRRHIFEGEMHGYWCNPLTQVFDPEYRVECEIPAYLLEKVLPEQLLNPSAAAAKGPVKRPAKDSAKAPAKEPSKKRKRDVEVEVIVID
jgi:Holliday junction resolvase YEN1